MFERISPEAAGVASEKVFEFVSTLERRGLNTHSLLLMKGDRVFGEFYWAPFDKDFCHRMYSETKSYVSVAIGLLEEDGVLDLDGKIASYFPEKFDSELPEFMAELTVREMLTMTTCRPGNYWFSFDEPDRTKLYFRPGDGTRPSGTVWEYDSSGSQVLGALVEKLSGMCLFDFLNSRIFSHLGTFKTAEILKTKNEDSWADSALVCTTRDMASFGRLLMKGGNHNGKQLINSGYVAKATGAVVDNRENCHGNVFAHGYGYQIWRTEQNSFAFNGMGCQFTVCTPDKDLLMVITGDNQGNAAAASTIIGAYMDLIVSPAEKVPLAENEAWKKKLDSLGESLKLRAIRGMADSPLRGEIEGKTYICRENHAGITKFSFSFSGDEGVLHYTNAQGDKEIPFGINKNLFGKFPQLGYADGHGGIVTENGFMYNDAVSACWTQENKLWIFVQIIDRYFGNCSMSFSFKDGWAVCRMQKTAEDFLNEYQGTIVAQTEN